MVLPIPVVIFSLVIDDDMAKQIILVALIADGLKGGTPEARRSRAWAMLSILIGGLTTARAVESAALADKIAASVQDAAVKAAGEVA